MHSLGPDNTIKRKSSIGSLLDAKHLTGEAGKYLAIQLAAYAVEMTTFQIFIFLDLKLIAVGNVAGKLAAGVFAFFMHGNVTFRGSKSRSFTSRVLLYALVLVLNSVISTALLIFLVYLGMNVTLGKLFSDVVLIIGSFAVTRQLIFTRMR
jgi:putative flippase GtrA